jgi:hypothetical protein
MALQITFLDIPMILAVSVGVYVFIRMWRYIGSELKTAPKESFFDRIGNFLSGVTFVSIATLVGAFIFTLVLSSIAINTIFTIQAKLLVYIDAMAKPWQFQTFIPFALLVLLVFAFSYTLIEYVRLSKRSQEGPMEIQQWIETKAINRVNPPWSFVLSLLLFGLIVLLTPTILSVIANSLQISESFEVLEKTTMYAFIFIVFIMLGPIFYLSYYKTTGNCQVLFQGSRVLSSRKFLRRGKNWLLIFFSLIALLSVISSFYSLYTNIPKLWGVYPDLTTSYKDLQGGFLESIIESLMRQAPNISEQDIEGFYYFTSIVPIDFLLFFITTVGFGLKGFSSAYLKKEPLNRPQIVLFAAYILTGIAFQIFLNVLVTWPWILPDNYFFITFELSDPQYQSMFMFFFAPAVAIENIFTIGFLLYNLFFNKNLKKQIDFNVLNEAILEQNIEILSVYSRSKNPEIRLMVVNAQKDLISTSEDENLRKSLVAILQEMIFDEDPNVNEAVFDLFQEVFPSFPPLTFLPVFSSLLMGTTENKRVFDKYGKVIIKNGKVDPKKIEVLIPELLEKEITPAGSDLLVKIVREISLKHSDFPLNTCIPLIDSKYPNFIITGLEVIAQVVDGFAHQYNDLYNKCLEFSNSANLEIRVNALKVIGGIMSHKRSFIDRFLADRDKFYKADSPNKIKSRIIGILAQGITTYPNTFDKLYPLLIPFISDDDSTIRRDAALSIGSLGITVTQAEYFELIHPKVLILANDSDMEVKQHLLRSLVMIGRVRTKIPNVESFSILFFKFLRELEQDDRHFILNFFESMNFAHLIEDFERLLRNDIRSDILVDVLSYFTSIAPNSYKDFDRSPIIQTLLSRYRKHPSHIESYITFFTTLSKFSLLAYLQVKKFLEDTMEEKNGESQALYIDLIGYYAIKIFKIHEAGGNVNSQLRLPQNFPPIASNMIEEIKSEKMALLESLELTHSLPFLLERLENGSIPVIQSTLKVFERIFESNPIIHSKLYPVLLSLRNQKDPEIIASLIRLFIRFALSYQNEYLGKAKSSNVNQLSNWKEDVIPYIFRNIYISDKETVEPLKKVFSILSEQTKEKSVLVNFLLEGLKKNPLTSYRLICFNSLLSIEDVIRNEKIKKTLFELSKDKDDAIRKAIIEEIGKELIRRFELNNDMAKMDKKQDILLTHVLSDYLNRNYIFDKNPDIRLIFLEQINKCLYFEKANLKILKIFQIATKDEEEAIAQLSIQNFFSYLKHSPEMFKLIRYIYGLTELRSLSSKITVIDQIQTLYQNTKNDAANSQIIQPLTNGLLPSIFNLAKDSNSQLRNRAFLLLGVIFSDDPMRIITSHNRLLKLLNNRNVSIQLDCLECISRIFREHFQYLSNYSKNLYILRLYQRFSRSKNQKIITLIASNLLHLIEQYPKKLNQILGITYHLLQVSDHQILQNCFNIFDKILATDPTKIVQIEESIRKVYKKAKNVFIGQYIEKLKAKSKKRK